jgi:hypothetical protein
MKSTPSTLFCLALACAAPLLAHRQAVAQDVAASPLDQLSGFVGDGMCTGKLMVTSKSIRTTTGKFHGEKALSDHWVVIRYDEDATASNSRPYHVTQYFSYDAKGSHFVDVLLDNSGETYSTGTSSGWQGDVMIFENTDFTSGSHPLFRDVFTRRGAEVISHTGYERDKSGKWIKTDEEVCKRT